MRGSNIIKDKATSLLFPSDEPARPGRTAESITFRPTAELNEFLQAKVSKQRKSSVILRKMLEFARAIEEGLIPGASQIEAIMRSTSRPLEAVVVELVFDGLRASYPTRGERRAADRRKKNAKAARKTKSKITAQ